MGSIVYWREKNGTGEYIILTEEDPTPKWIRENTRPGFVCEDRIEDEVDIPGSWPTEVPLVKDR